MFTFVTGGLRSGKSDYALRRASELGTPPWLYVAPEWKATKI
jgi:adenosyl cobinamide kinase/adenosyl cobinamide phosphate guanylyltransferase